MRTEVLPGLVVALILLMSTGSLYVWRSIREDIRALERRIGEIEAQRAAILRLEE